MTTEELKALIASKHDVKHAEKQGMVYQVWEDGEVTLQKSGELLWQRNLHLIEGGIIKAWAKENMPVVETSHGYAFVASKEDCDEIRRAMLRWVETNFI